MSHLSPTGWRPAARILLLVVLPTLVLLQAPGFAYDQYSVDGSTGNCADCHGDFRDQPYISLSDGQSWGDSLHDIHRFDMMNGDCDTCHTGNQRSPVFLGSSNGGDGLPAYSCAGCHGRQEDFNLQATTAQSPRFRRGLMLRDSDRPRGAEAAPGRRIRKEHSRSSNPPAAATSRLLQTTGFGAGLRQHHWRAGVMDCLSCHSDSDPNAQVVAGEDVLPPYYANPGTNHPDIPGDSCNPSPGFPEDFAATTQGLDNDGDGIYDSLDPDCGATVCGDGTLDAGEECDDGNTMDGDCCSASCTFEMAGSMCDDGAFCTEGETCDGAGTCSGGGARSCADAVACTVDSCDEIGDVCINAPDDASCDNGAFCDGMESCDAVLDCQAGTPVDCADGVACTVDTCDEIGDVCVNAPDDAACDNGAFCDGVETCDAALDCQAGAPVDCTDAVACTVDSCDEIGDTCVNAPDDAVCGNGIFCDGAEVCDPALGCQSGPPVDCDDSNLCTDDSCDEMSAMCDNVFDPSNDPSCMTGCGNGMLDAGEDCDDGNTVGGDCCSATCSFETLGSPCDDAQFCTEGEVCDGSGVCGNGAARNCADVVSCTVDSCDEAGDTCVNAPDDVACDNGTFCDGAEICDPVLDCQPGITVDCDDAVACTVDSCDEAGDTCVNAPDNVACDNGSFCDGAEVCDPVLDCQPSAPVDCDDGVSCTIDSCDEVGDTCAFTTDDLLCDDGQFCNGAEICNLALDCQSGTPVDCDDSDICTDDSCNEPMAMCDNIFDPGNDPTCQAMCPDLDGDGFSTNGGACGPVDCDDGDPTVNPGAGEICDDDVDNDCDGLFDAADESCEFTGEVEVRAGPLQDPAYAGSTACADCHARQYRSWQKTLHSKMLIRPGDAQAAGFPLPPPGAGVSIGSWSDVLFLAGQKWKTHFVDANGMIQGVQWNYLLGRWDPLDGGTLQSYDCGGCHTTGFDPNAVFVDPRSGPVAGIEGSWVEYGIGCEACHGPGAEHADSPTRDNINRIFFDWYDPNNDGIPDPVDIRSALVCANCHARGNRFQLQTDLENNEQFNDWQASPHSSTLQPTAVNTYCAQCHTPGNADYFASEHNFTNFEPSSATHVACLSCHNPHATSQERWSALAFPPGGRQDPRDEPARIARYRGSDGNRSTDDYVAFDNLDGNGLCADCHSLMAGGFRRHKDARGPEFIILNPPFNQGATFTVPHREHVVEDRAGCIDCHMHPSRTSINQGDVRSHSLWPNEWRIGPTGNLWHFSDTCGQCHREAEDCSWCHSDFGPAPVQGASSGGAGGSSATLPVLLFGAILLGGALASRQTQGLSASSRAR